MRRRKGKLSSKIVGEYIKAQKSLTGVLRLIQNDIEAEIKSLDGFEEELRRNRSEVARAFQNFDQKSNQLINMLSAIMKAINEMNSAIIRNLR